MTLLFFAVLLDLIGFGIILPLLPIYARDLGATGLQIGLLVTSYSVLQFFMAPLWGRLSDRLGRRPILILGLFGSAASYVVFAFSHSLGLLLASRLVAGFGGSTIPIAQAYIADITPPTERAGRMGLLGAAFGLGFVIGPALGGITSGISYAAPGLTAAGVCFSAGVLALVLLKESFPPSARATEANGDQWDLRHGLAGVLRSPQLSRTLVAYLFLTMAFATIQPTLSLLAKERFAFSTRDVGYLFALLGVVSVIVQGGLVRRLAPRFGEKRLLLLSSIPFAAGLLVMGTAPNPDILKVGLCLLGIGYGGAIPSALALVSRAGAQSYQGSTLGIGQSVGSTGRILGPALAGALFDYGSGFPYVAGAFLVLIAGAVGLSLIQPPNPNSTASTPAS